MSRCIGSGSSPFPADIDPANAVANCPTCQLVVGLRIVGSRLVVKRHA